MSISSQGELHSFVEASPGYFDGVDPLALHAIVSSAEFYDGKLAHVDYGDLKELIGEDKFFGLWERTGVPKAKFIALMQASCVGTPGICFPSSSFCDPDSCRHRG